MFAIFGKESMEKNGSSCDILRREAMMAKEQDEFFFINGSMGRLNAKLEMPQLPGDQQCPLVILCHGLRGTLHYHVWPLLSAALNEAGIGVLRFDFNGCGKSDGQFRDMTVSNEIDDLMSVISYARNLPNISNISLAGHSQGGLVAGMAAGICGARQIKALVLHSAAAVVRDDALRGRTLDAVYDPWHLDKPFYPFADGVELGRPYIQDVMNLPIYETTGQYDGPALILQGMADQIVPYTYAMRYHEALPDSELVIVPGADHKWTHDPAYAARLMKDWLVNKLAG